MADEVKDKEEYEPVVPYGWSLPELTEEEMRAISQHFRPHKAGIPKFTPLVCEGPDCKFASECVLVQNGIRPPLGRQCFVEANLVKVWMEGMAKELDLQEDDFFDRTSIGAIAVNQLMMKRAVSVLAREPMVVESFRAMTPEGDPVFENKANPAIAILREFTKQNQEIYRDLMVTRREKSKDAARKILSPTEAAQRLRERMKQVEAGLEAGRRSLVDHKHAEKAGEIIDAEFSVVEGGEDGDLSGTERGNRGEDVREEDVEQAKAEEGTRAEESPKKEGQGKVRMRRDPRTGFMMPYGEEEDQGHGNNGSA